MTDLGFGMADRRSVLVALFVFAISSIYFKYPLPIDISSAISLFVSLLIVTGFIYAIRNVWRIALVIVYFILRIPVDAFQLYKFNKQTKGSKGTSSFYEGKRGLKKSLTYAVLVPLRFDDWSFNSSGDSELRLILGSLGILDRAFLILSAFIATIPQFLPYRNDLGVLGILLMIAIYVITGTFTLMLKDALHKAEEDQERLISAARTQPNFPSRIETYQSGPDYGGGGY